MMRVLPGATDEARSLLDHDDETRARLDRVAQLIEGWETPYGLELLSTVHWALEYADPRSPTLANLTKFVSSWTPRKADLFKADQVERAAQHLAECGFAKLPGM